MKSRLQLKSTEYFIYALLFLIILLGPTLSTLFHGHELNDIEFLKNDLLHTFKVVIVYIIAFAIHDLFIAPLLVYKHKTWQYFLGVLVLGAAFMMFQVHNRPSEPGPPKFKSEQAAYRGAPMPGANDGNHAPAQPQFAPPKPVANGKRGPMTPPPPLRRHDIFSLIMFLFGVGTNIGIKYYFRSIEARKEIQDLEKENLKQSLIQLRYQLHPHFFMNTLNNIHALVDIDPEKAQACIIDLSRLMRYVLYESNHDFVQASREVEFMENYVRLSRIRYSDKLKFTVNSPDDGSKVWLPPLIFISFVENAFKHGVSHNKESYIEIGANIYNDDNGNTRMLWTCVNSKRTSNGGSSTKKVSEASGIGLTNVRQRLDLMFGDNYTLDINDGTSEFQVKMDIPVYTSDPNASNDNNNPITQNQ